jgi:hypothetical protein
MHPDQFKFDLGEPGGFVQNLRRDGHLAKIMNSPDHAQPFPLFISQFHFSGDGPGQIDYPPLMPNCGIWGRC